MKEEYDYHPPELSFVIFISVLVVAGMFYMFVGPILGWW